MTGCKKKKKSATQHFVFNSTSCVDYHSAWHEKAENQATHSSPVPSSAPDVQKTKILVVGEIRNEKAALKTRPDPWQTLILSRHRCAAEIMIRHVHTVASIIFDSSATVDYVTSRRRRKEKKKRLKR